MIAAVAPTPPVSALPAGIIALREQGSDFATGVNSFLNALPENTLGRLYNTPASCLAIFRLLPLVGRHLVLNMLWVDTPFRRSDVDVWASRHRSEGTRHLDEVLLRLKRLHIVREATAEKGRASSSKDKGTVLVLNKSFRENFKRALTGGGDHRSFGVPCDTLGAESVTVEQLDEFGTEQWETILHYMVGSDLPRKPSNQVLALLQHSGLMASVTSKSKQMQITSRGFQFLLEDVNTQLWDLLLQYLALAEVRLESFCIVASA